MSDQPTKTVRVIVEGRVQGVWFRGWTLEQATRRGLGGWVRNRADGTVEVLIHGPKASVNDLLDALWQGPPWARVDRVTVETSHQIPAQSEFRQYPTC